MTKEQLAKQLNGREIGEETNPVDEHAAKADGLIVVFGYSDDNAEFRGAIRDEVGCYDGGDLFLTRDGVLEEHGDCECKYCGFAASKKTAKKIKAVWGEGEYSWQFNTDLPHASFDILEGDEKFCRGIVISINDL